MTDNKTTINNDEILQGALSIACYVMDITKKVKNKDKDIENIVNACKKYVIDTKDYESLKKIFFDLRDGNTTFYARYLKNYFESQGVFFSYNVKKDKVFYSGNLHSLDLSYTKWKAQEKAEKLKDFESLSIKDKLLKKYNFDKLDKESLKVLASLVNDKIKSTI